MRLLRYILVPWTIFLIYSFFTFVFGQNGLYAKKYLQGELARLSENNITLQETNNELQRSRDNLLSDRDTLSVYARQLGYGKSDEEVIRIMGLGVALNSDLAAGQVLYAAYPDNFVSDKLIKIIAALFGLAILMYFLIRDLYPYKS